MRCACSPSWSAMNRSRLPWQTWVIMRAELKRLPESVPRSAFAEHDVPVVQRFHAALSQWTTRLRELEALADTPNNQRNPT